MKKVEMKPGQKYYYIVLRYMTWESNMNVKEGTVPSEADAWEKTIENLRNNFFLTKEDAEAPFNQGSEPLSQFIDRFREDAVFQRARTSLGEGSSTPDFGKLQIAIAPPDSTYFFAAWRELAPNEAAFCKGYLGSEMIEEYLFGRKDSQSPWMLIDYFRADDAIF